MHPEEFPPATRPRGVSRWAAGVSGIAAEVVCPVVILAIVVDAFRVVTWNDYGGRDFQIYATVARFWQDGFIPYRDLYDFKPPLVYAVLRLGYALWGYDAESFHRMVVLSMAFGAFMTYLGLRRASCRVAAPFAALGLMTLTVADPWHVVSQNTEILAAAFGAAAFGCAAAHQRSYGAWWAVGSGVCLALAMLAKQPAALWVVPVLAQLWLWGPRGRWPRRGSYLLTRALLFAVGCMAVLGAVALYFAWHGALKALYDAVIVDGSNYVGFNRQPWTGLLWRPTSRLALQMFKRDLMWPFSGALIVLVPLTFLRPTRWALVTWLWLLSSYVVCVIGPREEWHYLMASFPALAITVGMVFELALGDWSAAESGNAKRRLVGAMLLALFVYGWIWQGYYRRRRDLSGSIGAHTVLGLRIRSAAQPGDTLFVKDEPFDLYLYTGMPPMTRIIYDDAPTPGAFLTWASALQRQPTFIFVSHGSEQRMRSASTGFEAELAKQLAAHYERWIVDSLGIVYRRKGADAPPPNDHKPQGR